MMHRIYRLLDLTTALITAWACHWRIRGDANGWWALANAWAFWLLLWGAVSGAVALGRRSWRLGLVWTVAHLSLLAGRRWSVPPLVAALPTGLRTTPAAPRSGNNPPFSLFSFNMLNHPRSLASLTTYLQRQQPDLLLFQEAIADHAYELDRTLDRFYPHRFWLPTPAYNMGFGVAARIPFAVSGLWADDGFEPYALRLTVPIAVVAEKEQKRAEKAPDAGCLDLYCIQLIAPTNEIRRLGPTALLHRRHRQAQTLLDEIQIRRRPAILAGDWNSTEGSDLYQMLTTRLQDGWQSRRDGVGWTWPASANPFLDLPVPPLLRLDYLFHTDDRFGWRIAVEGVEAVAHPFGSDHRPLLAVIRLTRGRTMNRPEAWMEAREAIHGA